MMQQPPKTDTTTPDVVAVGPLAGAAHPVISLTVTDTAEKTFDEVIELKMQELEGVIASGQLTVTSQERTTLKGMDAFVTLATSNVQLADRYIDVMFKDVVIYSPDKIYTLQYNNGADDFDAQLPKFDASIDSFEIQQDAVEQGGGCLIATATFGSELAPQVQMLREARDTKVMQTATGAAFMGAFNQFYYSFSPAVADLERQSPAFREAVKVAITPMLYSMSLLNHADIYSESDMLAWGMVVIALNAAMYVAAPAALIFRLWR